MKKILLSSGLLLAIAVIVVGANTPKANADDTAQTTASVTVSSSCMLNATVEEPHEAEIVASTYKANIGKTILKSTCNDVNGYSIYAIGYTNTEWGRNDMLGTNTGRTIPTGTTTGSNSTDASSWSMKLTAVNGTYTPTVVNGFNNYKEIPDEYTKVASLNKATGIGNDSSDLETTYAVFAAGTQAPDTYVGKVKYTLVHSATSSETPCAGTYKIVYDANGGTGNMDYQTSCADVPIGLLPSGFATPSTDKQFALWNTESDGSGYSYVAGQKVTNLSIVGETITLYAIWAPKYMQDLTTPVCKAVANDAPYRLYDRRDGSDYSVRYIAGACWMTQNLRISGTINQQYSNFSTYENFNPCAEDLSVGNSTVLPRCHVSENELHGVYYNYPAVTAGTILDSNSTAEATEDICPKGWKLPSRTGSTASVSSLVGLDAAIFQAVASGYYSSSGYGGISNGNGYWWSSTAEYALVRWAIGYSSGKLLYESDGQRSTGMSIRCVLKNS